MILDLTLKRFQNDISIFHIASLPIAVHSIASFLTLAAPSTVLVEDLAGDFSTTHWWNNFSSVSF